MDRRSLLKGLAGLSAVAALPGRLLAKALGYPRLMQGPMLAPAADGLTVWARASGTFDVAVEYAIDPAFSDARVTPAVAATAANDLVAKIALPGLKPDTDYWYRMKVDGGYDRYAGQPFRVRTLPPAPERLRIAFGSCARLQFDAVQPIWDAVATSEPDLFLWLGDNIYADSDAPAAYADLYGRQRSIPALARLMTRVPQLAIWDDHDFGYNDSDGTSPVKDVTRGIFDRWWANPASGSADAPGIFFRHRFGPVDIFMLDTRYHRSPSTAPDGPGKTMLGAGQLAWLKRELKASRAPFKILASGTGWSAAERGGDSWANYLNERDGLLDFIRDERIGGCFGISGDVHMGEANCVPRGDAGGYDFYDMVSSGLAQALNPRFVDQRPEVRLRGPWVGSTNYGLLDFTFGAQPAVEFSVRNTNGAAVWDKPVRIALADLVNGRSSWRGVIDPGELKRRERQAAGGSYYS